MNGWGHDVARALPAQLDNVFAEVRLHAAQALGLEVLIQLELLRHHGLTLQHFPGTIALAQLKDDGPGRSRIGGPMHFPAPGSHLSLEGFKLLVQGREGVIAERRRLLSQGLKFRQGRDGLPTTHAEAHAQLPQGAL